LHRSFCAMLGVDDRLRFVKILHRSIEAPLQSSADKIVCATQEKASRHRSCHMPVMRILQTNETLRDQDQR
jgi:hypothetical protein